MKIKFEHIINICSNEGLEEDLAKLLDYIVNSLDIEEDPHNIDSYSIGYPHDILNNASDRLHFIWEILVSQFGEYGVSLSLGWLIKSEIAPYKEELKYYLETVKYNIDVENVTTIKPDSMRDEQG